MKIYIIKPKKENINVRMIQGILEIYPDAELANSIEESDLVVIQRGNWEKSPKCREDYRKASELCKRIENAGIYLDRFCVVMN